MSASGNGPLGSLLVIAPLVTVPILAIVGIPNFTSANVNSDKEFSTRESSKEAAPRYNEQRTGLSSSADELFAPLDQDVRVRNLTQPRKRTRSRAIDRLDDPSSSEFASEQPSARGPRKENWIDNEEESPPPARRTKPKDFPDEETLLEEGDEEEPPEVSSVEEFSWKTAGRRLKQLRVQAHYFTYLVEEGAFRFTALILEPNAEKGVERVRFSAVADEPLLAIKEVIEKIEQAETETESDAE